MPTTNRVQRARFALQMAEFAKKLGARMRERREELKRDDPRWTQDYAARQVRDDLTGAQYARWERGEVMPREDTIKEIARVLGLTMDDLYSTQKSRPQPEATADSYHVEDVARWMRMESKLDAILAHLGVDYLDELAPQRASDVREAETAAEIAKAAPGAPAEPRRKSRRPA